MSKIDPEIVKLYVLILKHGMKLKNIPRAWINVERAQKAIDPKYEMDNIPRYVKMIMKYGTQKG